MTVHGVDIGDHARSQAARRGVDVETVLRIAENPEQVIFVREGREVRQSRIPFAPGGKMYLVRVVLDRTAEHARIVTVYRTRKIDKDWRKG